MPIILLFGWSPTPAQGTLPPTQNFKNRPATRAFSGVTLMDGFWLMIYE